MMQEARIEDMRLPEWQRIVAVNLTAPFLMIRAALPGRFGPWTGEEWRN